MSDWDEYDFAVTHVVKGDGGSIERLKGQVIEDGIVRDTPIELTVDKAVEYLGYEGQFCTAPECDGELEPGAEITIDESAGDTGLQTEQAAADDEQLRNLPEA